MDGSILTSTLSSTSNVDRSITSDFARNSFRRGLVELHFCTLVAVGVGKIAENREKPRKFGKFFVRNICMKLSEIVILGLSSEI